MKRNLGWIISFADLVTILLTFMVLINGLAAPNFETVALLKGGRDDGDGAVAQKHGGDGRLWFAHSALMAPALEIIAKLDVLPPEAMFDQKELAEAVFQLTARKPADYERLQAAVREGVAFGVDGRGLAVKWDTALLFPEGSATLLPENAALLDRLAGFLRAIKKPVSVECHTDPFSPLEGGDGPAAWELSLKRARVAMEYLKARGVAESRFRLGAMGGSRPRALDGPRAFENGRLEIVIHQ